MPFLRAHAFKPRIRQNHIHLYPPPRNATRNAPHIGWTLRAAGRKAEEISSRPLKTKHGHFCKLSLLFKDFLHIPATLHAVDNTLVLAPDAALMPSASTRWAPPPTRPHGRRRVYSTRWAPPHIPPPQPRTAACGRSAPKGLPSPVRILSCASACPPSCVPYNKKPRLLAGVCKKYLSNYSILFFKRLAILSNSSSE